MTDPTGVSGPALKCLICGRPVQRTDVGSRTPEFPCRTCGRYRLSEWAAQRLYEMTGVADQRHVPLPNHYLISAVLRERAAVVQDAVYVESIEELIAAARPLPGGYLESVDRLLLYVGEHLPRLGQPVRLVSSFDYPIAFVQDGAELEELATLGLKLGYLTGSTGGGDLMLSVLPAGWQRLQILQANRIERRQAFVAMWFCDEVTPAYTEGIAPALEATGYRPLRIDRVEHNDKIDDRIVAAIRQSGLVVADFTGHRGGVYFEAGFAMGLGLPVIWTCREDHITSAHFDTRQYNHITWADPADLRERLRLRIEATLPTFPPL